MEQNKTGKYLKYAIGEIILVVIGILIALQINNWNEGRKTEKAEKQLYINIIKDLDKEHAVLQQQLNLSQNLKLSYRSIYEYATGKIDSLPITNPTILFISVNFSSVIIQNHENSVDQISSDSIRSQLNEYLLLAKELSTRRAEEVEDIKETRRPFLMKYGIIDIGKMIHDTTELESINLNKFREAKNSTEFGPFVASGYASNQALIYYTKQIIDENRALKNNLENSNLLLND